MSLFSKIDRARSALRKYATYNGELQLLAQGRLMAELLKTKNDIKSLAEVEFKIFSQWGDDGIIQWLTHHLELRSKTFVEFGVSDYVESNTRFLLMNNNWSGLVMDGSPRNVDQIVKASYFWQYDLTAKAAFVDKENVNDLIQSAGLPKEIGLLHIDIDGNDYWIWQAIHVVQPTVVILEYNSVFGAERSITIPYDKAFQRTRAHKSNLYYGASLRALYQLSEERGYAFIGCNSAGNNAYFVKREALNQVVRESTLEQGYVTSKFRESRDASGKLTYLGGKERLEAIRGLPVYNTQTGQLEAL
jgi:hypothetical protein